MTTRVVPIRFCNSRYSATVALVGARRGLGGMGKRAGS
jgi:hypothetical protein